MLYTRDEGLAKSLSVLLAHQTTAYPTMPTSSRIVIPALYYYYHCEVGRSSVRIVGWTDRGILLSFGTNEGLLNRGLIIKVTRLLILLHIVAALPKGVDSTNFHFKIFTINIFFFHTVYFAEKWSSDLLAKRRRYETIFILEFRVPFLTT